MIRERTFPYWAGPIVGAVAGAFFGMKAAARAAGNGPSAWMIAGAAAGGAVVGFLIALLDPRPRDELMPGPQEPLQRPMSLIERFLLLLGVSMCWLPFVGGGLAAATLVVTSGRTDWVRSISYAAVSVAVLVNALVVTGLVMDW